MTAPAKPPLFSVVIPARNDRERLALTLDSIARADVDHARVQVVVADDGSTDGTFETFSRRVAEYPFKLELYRGEFANQSAATNLALRHATGTFILSSAQDILFDPKLFAEHLAWHERFPDDDVAVIGYLPYAPNIEITPLMFYLVNGGFQFAYFMIKDPLWVPPYFLYAPNFSVRRSVLERVGVFDEQFPFGSQDTDLGIRLCRAGVRLVYNQRAVGYHNHPMTLEKFLGRQQTVGHAQPRLEAKHPDLADGPCLWDRVLAHHLVVSELELDVARDKIETLEPQVIGASPSYEGLWTRAFIDQEPLELFTEQERETIRQVDKLFHAYQELIQFHWGRGYIEESLERLGRERVEEIIGARMMRNQTSTQMRRTLRSRLAELALTPQPAVEAEYSGSIVVFDLEDYTAALRWLEPFLDPKTMRYATQLVLVMERETCSPAELEKLEGCVDVVVAENRDSGVLQALARCRARELVTVCSAKVVMDNPGAAEVARMVFARIPQVSLLGGAVEDTETGCWIHGFARDGSEAVTAEGEPPSKLLEVDAGIREYCLIRASVLSELTRKVDGRSEAAIASGEGWHQRLGRAAREAGRLWCYLPQLRCTRPQRRRRPAPARVAISAERAG